MWREHVEEVHGKTTWKEHVDRAQGGGSWRGPELQGDRHRSMFHCSTSKSQLSVAQPSCHFVTFQGDQQS